MKFEEVDIGENVSTDILMVHDNVSINSTLSNLLFI